jgi:apolipoprotein N-acyltransferase
MVTQYLLIAVSFCFVAFGHPAWLPEFGYIAAHLGYALFWKAVTSLPRKNVFIISSLWFTAVTLTHLYWMTANDYHGIYILFVWVILSLSIGALFGLLTTHIYKAPLSLLRILFLASLWAVQEKARLYFFNGFPWAPAGIALTTNDTALQLASLAGVYGLSFWVFFANLVTYKALTSPRHLSRWFYAMACALLPLCYGTAHIYYNTTNTASSVNVALVHTALTPEEKYPFSPGKDPYAETFLHWFSVSQQLKVLSSQDLDLIVFPESVYAFEASAAAYPLAAVAQLFPSLDEEALPPHHPPYIATVDTGSVKFAAATNAYWSQALATSLDSDIIIGLDDTASLPPRSYNAALHFTPQGSSYSRYEKHILMPGGEYLPFSWLTAFAKEYGITGAFTPGEGPKVFTMKKSLLRCGMLICSEELYGEYTRAYRSLGADILVSIHNDVWFPHSRLPESHATHGRIRAVENGLPLLRATNTGITAAFDSCGSVLVQQKDVWKSEVVTCSLPLATHATLYSCCGDFLIMGISLLNIIAWITYGRHKTSRR